MGGDGSIHALAHVQRLLTSSLLPATFSNSGIKIPPCFSDVHIPMQYITHNQLFDMLSANKHLSKYYFSSS